MTTLIVPPHVAQAKAKADLERKAEGHPYRCGNCYFAETDGVASPEEVRCAGLPPQVLIAGAVQGPNGEVQPNIVLMRPQIPKILKGCALWRARDIEGHETDGRMN